MFDFSRDHTYKCGKGKNEAGNSFDYLNFQYYENESSSNVFYRNKTKELSRLVNKVIVTELTEKQRECVMLVKSKGLKQKEAASQLGISKSTVSRHLKAAQNKFDRAYEYFIKFELPTMIGDD